MGEEQSQHHRWIVGGHTEADQWMLAGSTNHPSNHPSVYSQPARTKYRIYIPSGTVMSIFLEKKNYSTLPHHQSERWQFNPGNAAAAKKQKFKESNKALIVHQPTHHPPASARRRDIHQPDVTLLFLISINAMASP